MTQNLKSNGKLSTTSQSQCVLKFNRFGSNILMVKDIIKCHNRIMCSWNSVFDAYIYIPYPESQCTLAGPVYTGMPLECHWLTQCTLGYHWASQRILARSTRTPLEKLRWNSPTLECHCRNLVETAPHWDATGETLTFSAYTGTPLEGLWLPPHAPTHIVKHAE